MIQRFGRQTLFRQTLFRQTLFRQSAVRTTQHIFSTLKHVGIVEIGKKYGRGRGAASKAWHWSIRGTEVTEGSRVWGGYPGGVWVPLLRKSYNVLPTHYCTAPDFWNLVRCLSIRYCPWGLFNCSQPPDVMSRLWTVRMASVATESVVIAWCTPKVRQSKSSIVQKFDLVSWG